MRGSLLAHEQSSPPPPKQTLTRTHKSVRLPSVEDLQQVHLKKHSQVPKHHCMPPSDLHDMILRVHQKGVVRERQWRAIQLYCQANDPSASKEEACRLDRRGRSCLHAACAKKPTLAAINAILSVCDNNHVVLLQRDNHGRTPLSIAISSNASLDVVTRLLSANVRAATIEDRLGLLPLHLACVGYDHGQDALVRSLLQAAEQPSACCARESCNGRTPLHLAVESGAPLNVIQLLVDAYPKAVGMEGCGLNPLFFAIQQNASLQVIQTLVRALPQVTACRNSAGHLPLRRAIEQHSSTPILQCLCTSPDIVTDVEPLLHNTILHDAMRSVAIVPRESMVRLLVTTAPQVCTQKNRSGHTPLTLACNKYTMLMLRTERHQLPVRDWRNLSMLVRAAKYGHVGQQHPDVLSSLLDGNDFVVHAAVSTLLPKDIVMTMIDTYPNQAQVLDCNGDSCLFLAITGPYECAKSDLVLKLLDQVAGPTAESVFLPLSKTGRSMLSVAATAPSIHPEVINGLLRANPTALRQLDPVHGLFPFQLAAMQRQETNDDSRSAMSDLHPQVRREMKLHGVNQDLLQLSVIYRLLQAAPDLIVETRATQQAA